MDLLISIEELYNKTGINILAEIGDNQLAKAFLLDRQDEILDFIGEYAYRGRMQSEKYAITNKEEVVRAIIEQIKYTLNNQELANLGGILLHGNGTEKLSIKERLQANISPRSVQILKNAGLLYRGRIC